MYLNTVIFFVRHKIITKFKQKPVGSDSFKKSHKHSSYFMFLKSFCLNLSEISFVADVMSKGALYCFHCLFN